MSDSKLVPKWDEYVDGRITIGSVVKVMGNKSGKRQRIAFAVKGTYSSKKDFFIALRRELDDVEYYDLRTVKFHDIVGFMRSPQLMTLDYLTEDLLGVTSKSVDSPVAKKAKK
jgi:hypothetical protein